VPEIITRDDSRDGVDFSAGITRRSPPCSRAFPADRRRLAPAKKTNYGASMNDFS
jgi:hypothetical protein